MRWAGLLLVIGVFCWTGAAEGSERVDGGPSAAALAEDLAALQHRVDEERQKLQGLEERNDLSSREEGKRLDAIEAEIGRQRQAWADDDGSLQATKDFVKQSSRRSTYASRILLFGLIVEIIGALLLAGPALAVKQEDVVSLRAAPSLQDLRMDNVNEGPKLNYLGSLGALFLLAGFVLQYVGTLVSLGVSFKAGFLLTTIGLSVSCSVLWALLSQSFEQTPLEKLVIITKNSRRLFLPRRHNDERCDGCERVVRDGGEIWWLEEAVSGPEFEYLHGPYEWHYGHPKCLPKIAKYSNKVTGQSWAHLKKTMLPEFLATLVPHYERWWKGHAEHWKTKAKHARTHPHPLDDEFQHFRDRMRRVPHRP
jgi:hypothetical protein